MSSFKNPELLFGFRELKYVYYYYLNMNQLKLSKMMEDVAGGEWMQAALDRDGWRCLGRPTSSSERQLADE